MNIVEYVSKKTGMNQTKIAEKLGVTRSQVSKWKSGDDIPHEREEAMKKWVGIPSLLSMEWFNLSDKVEDIESWIELLRHINEYKSVSSDLIRDEAEYASYYIFKTLQDVGCQVPESPLTLEEFDQLEEQSQLPPFFRLLDLYVSELCIMEKWLLLNLKYPYEWNDDLDEKLDISIDVSWIEDSRFGLALRPISEDLWSACGVDLNDVRIAIREDFITASKRIKSVCQALENHKVPIKSDLYEFIRSNGEELLDEDDIYDSPFGGTVWDHASITEKQLLEKLYETQEMIAETNIKMNSLLSKLGVEFAPDFERLHFKHFPPTQTPSA